MVEEIVLTEEDERILDDVWKEMRRKLIQKRRQEERKKTAHGILKLARENRELRTAIVQMLTDG
jgi:Skp family chaperone for outer membrane proteins